METNSDGGAGQREGKGGQEAHRRTIKSGGIKKQNASGGKYRP